MKLKIERDLSYIDPLTIEFFQNNGTSSISVILLTNGQMVANLIPIFKAILSLKFRGLQFFYSVYQLSPLTRPKFNQVISVRVVQRKQVKIHARPSTESQP